MKNVTYTSSEWSDEAAHLRSLARALADCTKKKECKWRLMLNSLYQFMWFRYLSHMRAAKDQASLHIRTVSPDNVWIFIFLWVTRCVNHLREKWKKALHWRLCLLHLHKSKTEIRPASYVTMVVGSFYADKVAHTKKKQLSTTWQTCINA